MPGWDTMAGMRRARNEKGLELVLLSWCTLRDISHSRSHHACLLHHASILPSLICW